MSLASGTRLGPYEILAPLGAGGMGEAYRARDTRLDRTVAVKILPSHLPSDATLRQRFEQEAKAISSLNHPHICVLYDVGHQDGTDFLIVEYLEGRQSRGGWKKVCCRSRKCSSMAWKSPTHSLKRIGRASFTAT
jgi:serine/threonine protein kinase